MDAGYWNNEISDAQNMLEEMGNVENLRLILWLILVDRVDSIATSLAAIDARFAEADAKATVNEPVSE